MVKVLDCDQEVNEFELQSCYYVHFRVALDNGRPTYLLKPNQQISNIKG